MTKIRQIHDRAMSQVWDVAPHAGPQEGPGCFRRHDIHLVAGGMTPLPWTDVQAQMTTWTRDAGALGRKVASHALRPSDLPLALAELHAAFERVHPFIDGNGCTGRLVLNLMLVRLGWPPAIGYKRGRDKYLRFLDKADHGDPDPLAELLARSVLENLEKLIVPNIAGPARMVPLRSLASPDISYEALRQAALRGRLDAQLGIDGIWRSSQRAVKAYLASRHKRIVLPSR